MKLTQNHKLFNVEFGEPDMPGSFSISYGDRLTHAYFVAETYDEAARKALAYAEQKRSEQPVVDSDGSLTKRNDSPIKVKSVKVMADKIII